MSAVDVKRDRVAQGGCRWGGQLRPAGCILAFECVPSEFMAGSVTI